MTTQDPLPLPQRDPTPPIEDVPDETPDDPRAPRQDAPGEGGPSVQAPGDDAYRQDSARVSSSAGRHFGGDPETEAPPIARGPSAEAVGGYTGGMAAGDAEAVGMRQIVADESADARIHGDTPEESPANEAQADV